MLLKMNPLPRCRSSPLPALGLCLFPLLLSGGAVTTLSSWSIPQAAIAVHIVFNLMDHFQWPLRPNGDFSTFFHLLQTTPYMQQQSFPQKKHEEGVLKFQNAQAASMYCRQINP